MVAAQNYQPDDGALEVIEATAKYQLARAQLFLLCKRDPQSFTTNGRLMKDLAQILTEKGYSGSVSRMAAALMGLGVAQVSLDEIILHYRTDQK